MDLDGEDSEYEFPSYNYLEAPEGIWSPDKKALAHYGSQVRVRGANMSGIYTPQFSSTSAFIQCKNTCAKKRLHSMDPNWEHLCKIVKGLHSMDPNLEHLCKRSKT